MQGQTPPLPAELQCVIPKVPGVRAAYLAGAPLNVVDALGSVRVSALSEVSHVDQRELPLVAFLAVDLVEKTSLNAQLVAQVLLAVGQVPPGIVEIGLPVSQRQHGCRRGNERVV